MPFDAKRVSLQNRFILNKVMQYIDYIVQHYGWQGRSEERRVGKECYS